MSAKVMTGARAQLLKHDPSGETSVVAIANNVSWGLAYGTEPIFLLGRFSPDELVYTSQEVVSINTSGWRVIDGGPHKVGGLPALQDLLRSEYLELAVFDRQTNKRIAKFSSVRPVSYSTTLTARQPEEITITFLALLVSDESTDNTELAGASTLP